MEFLSSNGSFKILSSSNDGEDYLKEFEDLVFEMNANGWQNIGEIRKTNETEKETLVVEVIPNEDVCNVLCIYFKHFKDMKSRTILGRCGLFWLYLLTLVYNIHTTEGTSTFDYINSNKIVHDFLSIPIATNTIGTSFCELAYEAGYEGFCPLLDFIFQKDITNNKCVTNDENMAEKKRMKLNRNKNVPEECDITCIYDQIHQQLNEINEKSRNEKGEEFFKCVTNFGFFHLNGNKISYFYPRKDINCYCEGNGNRGCGFYISQSRQEKRIIMYHMEYLGKSLGPFAIIKREYTNCLYIKNYKMLEQTQKTIADYLCVSVGRIVFYWISEEGCLILNSIRLYLSGFEQKFRLGEITDSVIGMLYYVDFKINDDDWDKKSVISDGDVKDTLKFKYVFISNINRLEVIDIFDNKNSFNMELKTSCDSLTGLLAEREYYRFTSPLIMGRISSKQLDLIEHTQRCWTYWCDSPSRFTNRTQDIIVVPHINKKDIYLVNVITMGFLKLEGIQPHSGEIAGIKIFNSITMLQRWKYLILDTYKYQHNNFDHYWMRAYDLNAKEFSYFKY